MSYIGEKYYRVTLTLNYGLHLPEILELCSKWEGEFRGRKDEEKPIVVYYDFAEQSKAIHFIMEVRENFERNLIGASVL
jgi:hypothetical protein